MDIGHNECNYFTQTRNHENHFQNHLKLLDIGDGQCYFLYMQCKGINRKIVNMPTTRKHYLYCGNLEGGNKYQSLIR